MNTKLVTKLKNDERFYFTTLSGRKAKMLAYVRFIDVQALDELREDLIQFYSSKNCDFSLAFSQQSQMYISDYAIAKDCVTGKIFSFVNN